MQFGDGTASGGAGHVHESEALGAPGAPINDDRRLVHRAEPAEQCPDVIDGGGPGQVRHVDAGVLDTIPRLPAAGCGVARHRALVTTLRFLAVMVVINLALIPFLLLPPVFPFVFYAANGYLLGREYFELVALRRTNHGEARGLRKAHRGTLFATGTIAAFLLTVPLINLLAPVVATAAMVHLFESWRAGGRGV